MPEVEVESEAMVPVAAGRLPRLSIVVPSYLREESLVETLRAAVEQLGPADEIFLVDQTPRHQPETEAVLAALAASGSIRWVRKTTPSICEAMNCGAAMASGEVLVFLDDDAVPGPGFLQTYRRVFGREDAPLSACGQVLQPWDTGPSDDPGDPELGFNFAYRRPTEIVAIIAMNFAVRREVFLEVGGMDESFRGGAHRCDAEIGFRILAKTGRRTRFVPEATVRHLHAPGGTRAHGHKDTWAAIESAVGDYYFALRCLPPRKAFRHFLARMCRAPFNRNTLRHPWLVASVLVREVVAMVRAVRRIRHGGRYLRRANQYTDVPAEMGR